MYYSLAWWQSVALGDLTIGKFNGELQFTFYSGSRLIHMESVVSTDEDRHAFFYDTGLVSESAMETNRLDGHRRADAEERGRSAKR